MKKTFLILSLYSIVLFADPFMPLGDEPLTQPDSYHIIQLEDELFMVHMEIDDVGLSDYKVYNFPGTIALSGLYRIAGQVSTQITINTDDVTLDLGGNLLSGGVIVSSGYKNITLKNGTVDVQQAVANAIEIQSGCSNMLLQDLKIKNGSTNNILMSSVFASTISNCDVSGSVTGIALGSCSNLLIEDCNAICNTEEGFCMVGTSSCVIKNCKAISTGEGNIDTGTVNIFGFVSAGGYGNIFDGCIANGTQSLFSTEFDSNIAGFALRAATIDSQEVFEHCSKIINCEVSNTQTTPDGQVRPIGIWLEQDFVDMELTITAVPDIKPENTVNSVHWSPDAKLLAVGANDDTIRIYQIDHNNFTLMQIASLNPGFAAVLAVRWSPDCRLLTVGFDSGTPANRLRVYEFDRNTNTLIERAAPPTTTNTIGSIDWHPAGTYLAALEQGANELHIFSYDRTSNTMAFIASLDDLGGIATQNQSRVKWNPDGTHIATTRRNSTNSIALLTFVDDGLFLVQSIDLTFPGSGIDWSFDGKFLAWSSASGSPKMTVYTLDRASNSLINPSSGGSPTIYNSMDIVWSPDAFSVAGTTFNTAQVTTQKYNRDSNSITSLTTLAESITITDDFLRPATLSWSPDGQFIALGSNLTDNQLVILYALHSPSKNVIKDNVVYCNSGGSISHGIGISANSISNLVIGNTAYNNPINPPGGVFTNYAFVTNVFNPLFGYSPSALQNVSITGPIQTPMDIDLAAKQIEDRLCDIQTKIDALLP